MTLDRRTFHRTLLGAATAAALPAHVRAAAGAQPPRVNGARLNAAIQRISEFGRNDLGGVTRPSYTDADVAARTWTLERMREAGLETRIDEAGNLVGSRVSPTQGLQPIITGSHIDSVPQGGRYDGIVGSMAAIEVARTLAEAGINLRHTFQVIIFSNEENGKIGSKALWGAYPPDYLDFVTNSGLTVREGLRKIGGDPDTVRDIARQEGSVSAFIELHIEQGATLESRGTDIGVVQGIVGIRRWNVTVEGFANHAGTTPMAQRRDALLAAARLVDAVNDVVRTRPGPHVGTVGQIAAEPGAANVIAGRASLTIELRDLSMDVIDALFADIEARASSIAEGTGTQVTFDPVYRTEPATCDERFMRVIADEAGSLGLSTLPMPSGAGHDAQEMALLGPIGMIFVPSRGGISHSAEEFTDPADIENGANVLLRTLLRLDAELET